MAMNVGGDGDEKPLSDINTTPLVDVMLVLLIIFLIAKPAIKALKDYEEQGNHGVNEYRLDPKSPGIKNAT